jgi:ribonuclease D
MRWCRKFCKNRVPETTVNQAIEAAKHPNLLETPAQLEAAERAWTSAVVLGIDTEFVRERTYRADLGLVQVSDGRSAWLWDPLRFDSPAPVRRLLENPEITKILHSGSEDLEVMRNTLGAIPEPLVDTQIGCAMLGQPLQLSFQGAAKWLFDVKIDKEHTRSNWLKRPLQPGQLQYAAMDVVLLPLILDELRPRLEAAGRWAWLQEDVARMQRNSEASVDPEEAWLRIAGASRLDDASLRALRSLARWREQTAEARNRARGFVVSDAGLLELARLRPATAADLRRIEHLHPRAVARHERDLLQMIGAAAADRSPLRRIEPLSDTQRRQLNQMRQRVQARARELEIDPALLASRRELEKLVRAGNEHAAIPERFLGWRRQVITDELLTIMG